MIQGVDCAYPQPSYPSWARVVCGYAGGHTVHQWTLAEVAAVHASGRVWFAIWTARNAKGQPPLTAADGTQDAAAMAARLSYYQYDKNLPVFYDIEPGIFDLDPNGAKAAIGAWKAGMQRAGWVNAYAYTIARQGGDWIADWTNVIPASIPAGKIGVQYGGDQGSFDYDVFADSLLGEDVALDPNDPIVQKLLTAVAGYDPANPDAASLAALQHNLLEVRDGATGFYGLANAKADIAALKTALTALQQQVAKSPTLSGTLNVTGALNVTEATP